MKTEEAKIKAETIDCTYHPIKDCQIDPAGYFLIRIIDGRLEAGFCEKPGVISKIFRGEATSIYNTIAKTIKLQPEHYAYLGRELTKAEFALLLGIDYIQDTPLDLRGFKKVENPETKLDPNNYMDVSVCKVKD